MEIHSETPVQFAVKCLEFRMRLLESRKTDLDEAIKIVRNGFEALKKAISDDRPDRPDEV